MHHSNSLLEKWRSITLALSWRSVCGHMVYEDGSTLNLKATWTMYVLPSLTLSQNLETQKVQVTVTHYSNWLNKIFSRLLCRTRTSSHTVMDRWSHGYLVNVKSSWSAHFIGVPFWSVNVCTAESKVPCSGKHINFFLSFLLSLSPSLSLSLSLSLTPTFAHILGKRSSPLSNILRTLPGDVPW